MTEKRIPKVRMAKPTGRPIQLRYTDPATGKEVRITTKTHDPIIAGKEKKKLEAKLCWDSMRSRGSESRPGPTCRGNNSANAIGNCS
jgi:hypothetical protein